MTKKIMQMKRSLTYKLVVRELLALDIPNSLFGLKGEGGGVERNRVELAKNRQILGQFHSTLLYSPSLPLNQNGL